MTHCPEDDVFSIILCVLDFSEMASPEMPLGEPSVTASFNVDENKPVEATVAGVTDVYNEPTEKAIQPSWLRDRAAVSNAKDSFIVLDHKYNRQRLLCR